jgi:hypothetical protein
MANFLRGLGALGVKNHVLVIQRADVHGLPRLSTPKNRIE